MKRKKSSVGLFVGGPLLWYDAQNFLFFEGFLDIKVSLEPIEKGLAPGGFIVRPIQRGHMAGWVRQIPGFRSGRWWKRVFAVLGYAIIFLLIVGGLYGGAVHALATNVLGLPGLVIFLKVGPWVNALGPPYVATEAFLALVYVLNARASTFLLGAESLTIILLAANAWGVRSYIPFLNSRSKALRVAGWLLLLFLCIGSLAVTLERRPWGFLNA